MPLIPTKVWISVISTLILLLSLSGWANYKLIQANAISENSITVLENTIISNKELIKKLELSSVIDNEKVAEMIASQKVNDDFYDGLIEEVNRMKGPRITACYNAEGQQDEEDKKSVNEYSTEASQVERYLSEPIPTELIRVLDSAYNGARNKD